MKTKLAAYEKSRAASDPLANWRECLEGGDSKLGKEIFYEKAEAACLRCHKIKGEGGDVDIEGDKFKVPSFKNEKVAAGDDKKYTRVIEEGDDKMPAFKKKLSADEIAGLIKFIRKEFQGK